MKFKVNMLFVVILSLVAGMAGNYFFDNRWLGLIIALPLCALYIYQVYQVQADYREQHARKNTLINTDDSAKRFVQSTLCEAFFTYYFVLLLS